MLSIISKTGQGSSSLEVVGESLWKYLYRGRPQMILVLSSAPFSLFSFSFCPFQCTLLPQGSFVSSVTSILVDNTILQEVVV